MLGHQGVIAGVDGYGFSMACKFAPVRSRDAAEGVYREGVYRERVVAAPFSLFESAECNCPREGSSL